MPYLEVNPMAGRSRDENSNACRGCTRIAVEGLGKCHQFHPSVFYGIPQTLKVCRVDEWMPEWKASSLGPLRGTSVGPVPKGP